MAKSRHVNSKIEAAAAFGGCLLATSCILSAFVFGSSAEAAGKNSMPPPKARAMTSAELYMLYRDKSWQWTDGAGRMQAEGRRFSAWAGSGEKAAWAEGRWTVADNGRLCFKAQWHSSSGVAANRTCFSHRELGETIYQKREPSGDWYVFKHAAPATEDEFSKLVSQDLVTPDLQRIKSELEPAKQLSDANLKAQQ